MSDAYKPVVPKSIAKVLEKKKRKEVVDLRGDTRKEWERWKEKYSRKYKYALKNGWIVEED